MTPKRPRKRRPLCYRQLGGWDLGRRVRDPRCLFKVTIRTSIDNWDEYILARNRKEVDRVLKQLHSHGWAKGWEPTITHLDWGLDSIYITR